MIRLAADGWLVFATRSIRLFAYGGLSVVLVLYLVSIGLTESDIGLLLTATLLGDTFISLYLTTQADRIGRRRMLIIGAVLMAAAGLAFGFTTRFWLLLGPGPSASSARAVQRSALSYPLSRPRCPRSFPIGHARTSSPGTHWPAHSPRRSVPSRLEC